jgi:TolA-binding protein
MTKRQEALESMAQLLQGNPQLWAVAGDLFVKNMDWPGAQEMAKRFEKTIDPMIVSDDDKPPALQAAEQQIQQMGQQMEQMASMLRNVNQSMEAQELKIKEYDAETKRISAVSSGMTPEQIQDIVQGTLFAALESGDLSVGNMMPQVEPQQLMGEMPQPMGEMPQQ